MNGNFNGCRAGGPGETKRGRGRHSITGYAIAVAMAIALAVLAAGCGSSTTGDTGGSSPGGANASGSTTTGATSTAAIVSTAPVHSFTDTGGRLLVSETYYDAGDVQTGTMVEHDFELKNIGNGPLSLVDPTVKRLEGC